MLDLHRFPLWVNLALFVAGAVVVWLAGTRLSVYADRIAERTGVGRAFIGALLLGGITSLPEAATTVTAATLGSAPLAVNNIFGGVAMQVAVLAVADAAVPGEAISVRTRQPSVLLQGALLIVILNLAALAILTGDVLVFGVGLWPVGILAASIFGFYLMRWHQSRETWEPEAPPRHGEEVGEDSGSGTASGSGAEGGSMPRLLLRTVLAGFAILVAGFTLARSGEVIGVQTPLGENFVGVLLLAVSTSLPEVSTTLAAARMGRFGMAFSNIFGANILDTSMIFLADVAFRGGPILGEVGRFSLIGALLGVLLTGVYLVGLLERRRRVVLGMGIDSLAVLILYGGGMYLLYTLR